MAHLLKIWASKNKTPSSGGYCKNFNGGYLEYKNKFLVYDLELIYILENCVNH